MPVIRNAEYHPPIWLLNGHFDTIYPALFRKIHATWKPKTVHLTTQDQDEIELDYYDQQSDRTVIISHGLEGNSKRPYMLGMVNKFLREGWNAISWSYRGCNGKINKTIISYHSGFTQDLKEVIAFADKSKVSSLALVGFSLGGNITLRYLAERDEIHNKVKAAVTLSVPVDLHQGCIQISRKTNIVYSRRFLKTMKQKVIDKAKIFPEIDTKKLDTITDLKSFDDHYTAPIHGFRDALDYYSSCSAIFVLDQIETPTLIISAENDPFLPEACYPYKMLESNKFVHFLAPKRGGHVGFMLNHNSKEYWSEKKAFEFVKSSL